MPVRSVRFSQLGIVFGALALLAALAPLPAEAAPPGWTEPQPLPRTSGAVNQESATAPDGTDAVIWVAGVADSQVAIRGRIRRPGTDNWVTVKAYVTDAAQNLALVGDRHGDFWVTWVRYNSDTGIPQVLLSRLDSDAAKLTTPRQPFSAKKYGHEIPAVAVTYGGAVFVSATASTKVSTNPPVYRAQIGIKRPGQPWSTRYLSPIDVHAVTRSLAVSPKGHAVVAFTQGYELGQMRVRAATRPAGPGDAWTVSNVSPAGDGQIAKAAIGPDGTAAVTWNAPSTGSEIVRLAFRDVTSADDWVSTDLVTGPGVHRMEQPVVDSEGFITTFWWSTQIWARQVQDGVLLTPNTVSPGGVRSDVRGVQMGNAGRSALLYQSYDGGINNLGLRFRWVDHGLAYEELVLTTGSDGSANTVQLGLDAADQLNVVWTAGDYPATELQSMGNPGTSPLAMSAPYFGEAVTKATMTGRAQVGRVLKCDAGYVVEANDVRWRWYRNGDRIAGATGRRYTVRDADAGKRLKCAMVAVGLDGSTKLTSHARVVG